MIKSIVIIYVVFINRSSFAFYSSVNYPNAWDSVLYIGFRRLRPAGVSLRVDNVHTAPRASRLMGLFSGSDQPQLDHHARPHR